MINLRKTFFLMFHLSNETGKKILLTIFLRNLYFSKKWKANNNFPKISNQSDCLYQLFKQIALKNFNL